MHGRSCGVAPLITLLVFLLLGGVVAVPAQESDNSLPAWLLLEEGHRRFDDGEFGAALRSYRSALAEAGVFPEAELGMARVYAAQADDLLAKRYYRTTLEQEGQLEVAELAYQARLELAELYRRGREPEQYEEVLLEIVAEDRMFSAPEEETTRRQMREVLLSEGLDRLLVLYRLEELFSLEAHQRLAAHFLEGGRDIALDHAMFAVVKILSEAIAAYRERYFDYEYEELLDFLARLEREPRIQNYLSQAGLYRSLYDLGRTVDLYQPRSGVGREILATLVQIGEPAGRWAGMAQRYLR